MGADGRAGSGHRADVIAGICGGIAPVVLLHPFDLAKTRAQARGGPSRPMEDVISLAKREGFRALFWGNRASLAGSAGAWGIYFPLYNAFRTEEGLAGIRRLPPSGSALVAGVVATLATTPLFLAKTRLALREKGAREGVLQCLRDTFREEGIPGLWRGAVPSLILVPHGAVQFAAYERMRDWLDSDPGPFMAGALGSLSKAVALGVTFPAQTARAKVQRRVAAPGTFLEAVRSTLKQEGFFGFYRGFVPALSRALPSSGLTFLAYEGAHSLMRNFGSFAA